MFFSTGDTSTTDDNDASDAAGDLFLLVFLTSFEGDNEPSASPEDARDELDPFFFILLVVFPPPPVPSPSSPFSNFEAFDFFLERFEIDDIDDDSAPSLSFFMTDD